MGMSLKRFQTYGQGEDAFYEGYPFNGAASDEWKSGYEDAKNHDAEMEACRLLEQEYMA